MVLEVLEFGKQSRLYLQLEVRRMGLLDLSGTLGSVRHGGIQDLALEQLVKATIKNL
jgi:hypothetical protein